MASTPTPYRAKDGAISYKVRFRLTPGTNPVSETFTTLAEAEKFARLVERVGGTTARQMRQATDRAHTDVPTLRAQLETFLRRTAAHATPGTVADYRRMAERTFLVNLGDLPIDEITRDDVADWVAWQRKQPARGGGTYAPKSIANAQRLLSSVLQSACDEDHPVITRNVAKGAKLPKDATRREMVFLTEAEFVALFQHIPDRYRPLVALLACTGMRWGEATALTRESFDLDAAQPVVRVERAWKKGETGVYLGAPKSPASVRTIGLPPSVVEQQLRATVEATPPGALVFSAPEGGRLRAQNFHPRVWRPAVEAAGIGKRPRVHDLRHSHASWLLMDGMPPMVVQKRLGHEDPKTTMSVYGHLTPDAHWRAVEVTERALAALPAAAG